MIDKETGAKMIETFMWYRKVLGLDKEKKNKEKGKTMTDKEIDVKYKSYNEYEGRHVRPAVGSKGIQANIGDDLSIRCIKYRSQLENKLYVEKIVEVLQRENLL